MTDIIIRSPIKAEWRDGSPAIDLHDLPTEIADQMMSSFARRLTNQGFSVLDKRERPERVCLDCGQPTATPRAKYCPDCQIKRSNESKRRWWLQWAKQ